MADVNRWISSGSTDWNVAGNWSLGAIPSATQIPRFDGLSGVSLVTGPTGVNPTNFPRIIVTPDYSGNWGASGSPIAVGCDATADVENRFVFRGSGTCYTKPTTTTSYVVNGRGTFNIDGDGSGAIHDLAALAGTLTTGTTARFVRTRSTLFVGGTAIVTINDRAGTIEEGPWLISQEDGTLTYSRTNPPASLAGQIFTVLGGTCTLSAGLVGDGAGLRPRFFVGSQGRMIYKPTTNVPPNDDTAPDAIVHGLMDLSQSLTQPNFNLFIVGPTGTVLGSPGDVEGNRVGASRIDLSDPYP